MMMLNRVMLALVALLMFCSIGFAQSSTANSDDVLKPITIKKDLYPADADAKKEIDDTLKTAATEKKRVILVFGGNWCYDCHVLDQALHEGEAGKIVKESFLLVHIDIGEGDKNLDLVEKYKTSLDKGVPTVAILGSDGKVIYSSSDGEFEAARNMLKKDLVAFLNQWKALTQ
ncbi:MAG TPA: thioredoxin family protein [Pyrinomonadaceae bacterium]|jgi:thioredoxin-related protein|nr:thioredoxin family protein [Pyrinomonadaceae bacterium]